jgi:L-cysteine desulfidase
MSFTFSEFLDAEWQPALGCTEPASIAYAAASAAAQATGPVRSIHLTCDPRIYKNCYAVGIPHSSHKVGIRWALAIGALLPDPEAKLECFKQIDAAILQRAGQLIDAGALSVNLDASQAELLVDCTVERAHGSGRAVIERDHTRLVRLERDGETVLDSSENGGDAKPPSPRSELAKLAFEDLVLLSRDLTDRDRVRLGKGTLLNLAIAKHGLSLFPERFVELADREPLTRISRLVCAGVYARMWGEDFRVMSLAGSGNKGIVCAVPMSQWGQELGADQRAIDEALALACVVTSATTFHLGTLSAVCGCSNAAGIGLAAGLVQLEGGGPREISLAINNMVGNVTGMVCDGAKIGCALKTMTSVDAAFRSASLALSGIGIPVTDGIVGDGGMASLSNLGRLATRGMVSVDAEILDIMQEKLAAQGKS